MRRFNKKSYGILLAAILPIVILLILYRMNWYMFSFEDFIKNNYHSGSLGDFLSMSVLANLAPFILANQMQYNEFAKGVFMTTVVYAIPVIILYFI